MTDTCVFCAIGSGAIAATVVHEEADLLAFADLSPQAPVHVLVIPKSHHETVGALSDADPQLAARLIAAAVQVARAQGISESGYRLVINTGSDGGQSVDHAHVHVLGGRRLQWPPG